MNINTYRALLVSVAIGFTVAFCVVVIPGAITNPDPIWLLQAGFVNPVASGYALDAISCWVVLALWVVYEARTLGIRGGWIALLLAAVPGVATGFAVYLLLRLAQRAEPSPEDS